MTLNSTRVHPGVRAGVETVMIPSRAGTERDRAVDLMRALCLISVVGLHALMVGVSTPAGAPRFENALEGWDGFTVFSWFTQMMPLFFILGGFASAQHYRRLRDLGVSPAGYVAARLARLLPIPLAAAVATLLALSALTLADGGMGLALIAGWRISQPLWFLGVYLLCAALVPAMLHLHELAPRASLIGLGLGVGAIDALRLLSGVEGIGFANLAFVWLFIQQLGFWMADRRVLRIRTAGLVGCALLLGTLFGLWPTNLFAALNPPSAVLALLGIVQFTVFGALRPRLALWADRPGLRRVSDALNARALTIYSWHMLAIVLLTGALLVAGTRLPAPLTAEWWLSRPPWLAAVGLSVAFTVAVAGRLERRPNGASRVRSVPSGSISAARVVTGTLSGCGGVLVVLAANGTIWSWLLGATLLGCGVRAVRGRGRGLRRPWRTSVQNAKATPSSTP